jgi:hypothetical protein
MIQLVLFFIMSTLNCKRKKLFTLCGELALEETRDLSLDKRMNEWMNEWMNDYKLNIFFGWFLLVTCVLSDGIGVLPVVLDDPAVIIVTTM